jgi:hypothetical protein
MSSVTAAFYAIATFFLGVVAVALIPTGGWREYAEQVRTVAMVVTIGGPVFFLGAAILGRQGLGD